MLIAGDPVLPEYRAVVTGTAEIEIRETGDYLIYHEYSTDLPSVQSLTDKPDTKVSVRVRASIGGQEVSIEPHSSIGHYSGMGRSGYALGQCVIQTPGVYVFSISQKPGNELDAVVVAFGREGKSYWFVASLLFGFIVSLPLIYWRLKKLRKMGN